MTASFVGETLSYAHVGTTLEVTLHRSVPGASCNEIGEQTLRELEALVAYVGAGAGGARRISREASLPS